MADGNNIASSVGNNIHVALEDLSVSSNNTATSVSFNGSAWIQWALYWQGHWKLYTGYTDNSSGGGGQTNAWSPARIDTSSNGWACMNRIGSGQLVFSRKTSAYTVTVYVGFETPWGTSYYSQAVTIPALSTPSAPSNCTHTRESDNKNTVSWTNNGTGPRSNNLVERSVDGGGFSEIASCGGSATSYVDATTQPDHAYAYRVRALFSANGYSLYSAYSGASAVTYNTPACPGTPFAARISDTGVRVTFTNTARTETATELQRSSDVATWTSVQTVSSADVTAIDNTPGGGTFYYRVRNTRGSLLSAWSLPSNAVVTIIAPASPTLTSPLSGERVSLADTAVRFSWIHNPIDGSSQTAAELRLSLDGGITWIETLAITGAADFYEHEISWAVNAHVLWQVRTKGAHQDFGEWSSSRSFVVYQVPQVAITAPANDTFVADTLPICVTWDYSDESGTQMSSLLRLIDAGGALIWSKQLTTESSYDIRAADLVPENGKTYTLSLSVTSTSTLTAETSRTFSTDYDEPAVPVATATVDRARAAVDLLVFQGAATEAPDTVALSVIRQHADGHQVSLAERVPSGTSLQDPYCPLEQDIIYLFIAHSEAGAISRFEVPVRIASKMSCWLNFGDKVCALVLDASYERQTDHDVELFYTAGSEWPMAFYGDAKQMSGSLSGTALRSTEDLAWQQGMPLEISDFDELAAYTGTVVIRLPYLDGFVADVFVSQKAEQSAFEGVSVSWRRVRNHGLAI